MKSFEKISEDADNSNLGGGKRRSGRISEYRKKMKQEEKARRINAAITAEQMGTGSTQSKLLKGKRRQEDIAKEYSEKEYNNLESDKKRTKIDRRNDATLRKKIVEGLSNYSRFLSEREIKDIISDIKETKQGLEHFKESYERGNEEWRKVLMSPNMQAVFLGVKARTHLEVPLEEKEHYVQLFQKYATGKGLCITDAVAQRDAKVSHIKSAEKVLTNSQYSSLFDNYIPGSSVEEYLSEHDALYGRTLKGEKWSDQGWKNWYMKEGVLYSFPPNSVEAFADPENSKWNEFRKHELEGEEKRLRDEYVDGDNAFKDQHQSEIRSLLSRIMPEESRSSREYILARRVAGFFGTKYIRDNRSDSDKYVHAKLEFIFNQSGMPEYCASVESPNS